MPFAPLLNEMVLFVPDRRAWWHFYHPLEIIAVHRLAEIPAALFEVENQVSRLGRWAAGFLSYEAAPAMDSTFQVNRADADFPLLWFGIYPEPACLARGDIFDTPGDVSMPGPWLPTVCETGYGQAIGQIKEYIAQGETYQVNFTYRLRAEHAQKAPLPPAWPIFASLASAHAAPYAAFLETERWAICSISPELFFTLDGSTITSRPMKGTAPRGKTLADDLVMAAWLHASEKNRAENLMILDMARNDLGRVARTGSVCVPEIFGVEKYPTVWQMTSTVQAKTEACLPEIFRCLFPAASITGAPKIRTMQIIASLEATARQIYTGAIGFYCPGRQAQYNVAIRTLLLDKWRQCAEYGVGGGIVWDSAAAEEWEETKTKARILHEQSKSFDLLETMRWTPIEGWFLLEEHLERLASSADYFSFPFDRQRLLAELEQTAQNAQGIAQRVRLRLTRDGQLHLEAQPLPQGANPTRIIVAQTPVDSSDRFLYHKTTRRECYQQALAERPGYEDVLLWNEGGEVTESTMANLIVMLDGQQLTPRREAGLLPGTFRAWLLKTQQVAEASIRLEDLKRCSQIFLANSVRGMWEVRIEEHP
jgi:para-aminobenzoate synthetase/4-amino-4-deoxychorismate lyase